MTIVFEVSLSLLVLQIVFSVITYIAIVKVQKSLLTKQEQKEQKISA